MLSDHHARVVEEVLALPDVRADAVARAQALLGSPSWCRASEIAAELVECLLTQQVP